MHPVLFELPRGYPLRSFGVAVALGFLLGSWILGRLAARGSPDPAAARERYGAVTMWVLVGVILGARLMYVGVEVAKGSQDGQMYLSRPWTILAIWQGGLVMYGGLFGGLLGGALGVRRHRLPMARSMDIGLTAGFFGYAVGRVGCLLVGDDYGAVVPERFRHLPFPITLRVPEVLPPHSLFGEENAGQVLWATQAWMSINGLLLGLLGLWLLKRPHRSGQVALVLLLAYAVTRFFIEGFRGDAVRGTWFGDTVSTSQLIGIGVALAALALLVRLRARGREALP